MGKFVGKDLIIGAEGKVMNNYKLDDVVARPTQLVKAMVQLEKVLKLEELLKLR
jgi:hypothetical protein